MSTPVIRFERPLDLTGPVRTVVAGLFTGYAGVVVEGEFASGFSDARVLKVTPYRDVNSPELPSVVKVGPADDIRAEYDAYRRFIRGRLSGVPEVWGEPIYVRASAKGDGPPEASHLGAITETEWGGLRYSLVGAGLFDVVSLAEYAASASPADLVYVLEDRLFVHLGSIWRQSRIVSAPLDTAYAPFVRPDMARYFRDALGPAVDLSAFTVTAISSQTDRPDAALPNPLIALPLGLTEPLLHRIATIHGDLNLENVLVDPAARTVNLIDFSHSREDHVVHDLLRLESGLITRLLPKRLHEAGLNGAAVVDLLYRLHTAADDPPPYAELRAVFVGLVAVRKAASQLLAEPADWREYLVGLAAYLIGSGKYRNLNAAAKVTAFWAAATSLHLAELHRSANVSALALSLPWLLKRDPALEAYRQSRIAEWSGPRYELDERFVQLSLMIDQGEDAVAGRWQTQTKRYGSLRILLEATPDPALVVLGAPGSGKSTMLRRLELEYALAAIGGASELAAGPAPGRGGRGDRSPVTFFLPLSHYRPASTDAPLPTPRAWLNQQWQARFPKLPALDELLHEGRVILLLDALNEIPASSVGEARERVLAWKDFVQDLATTAPGCRVVFSCRSLDYSIPLSTPALRVPQVLVEPLDDDRVRRFIQQYLPDQAERLWAAIQGSGHLDVMRSPYFLRLLVQQVETTGDVPLGRAALFTGFVRHALLREVERNHPLFAGDTLLADRDLHRLTAARTWRSPYDLPERGALLPRLSELAYRMQVQDEAKGERSQVRIEYDTAIELLAHDRAADIISAGTALGVLDEDPGQDEVLFVHQLVQEYFAARKLAKAPRPELVDVAWRTDEIRPSVSELIELLPPADELPPLPQTGWEETTALAAAMTADAESFVHDLAEFNLALAGRCVNEAEVKDAISPRLLDQLRSALANRLRDRAADLRDRIKCAQELGRLGHPEFAAQAGIANNYLLPPFVAIAAGTYPIGVSSPFEVFGEAADAHMPAHTVHLDAFLIAKYPVTNAEWALFIAGGGYENERWWDTPASKAWREGRGTNNGIRANVRWWREYYRANPQLMAETFESGAWDAELLSLWEGRVAMSDLELEAHLEALYPDRRETLPRFWLDQRYNHPSQPVIGICWYEARAYCAWISAQSELVLRLPSEVEWEAAARGNQGRRFPYGDQFSPLGGNTVATRIKRPSPVGVFVEGDTPEGLADMSGNVYEWTRSVWGRNPAQPDYRYPYDAQDGREDVTPGADMLRVVRGGTWNLPEGQAESASRDSGPPDARYDVGMRLVQERTAG